jgi:DNA repair protein SbcD/Mre11
VLDEPARAGLADEVRERLPDAVEVVLAPREAERVGATGDGERLRRTPQELFREYLAERDAADDRVIALFDELVDDDQVAAP